MQMPIAMNGFKLVATLATISLGLGGVIHSRLMNATEDTVARSARYDVAWTGVSGRLEALELEKFVARYATTHAQADLDAAKLYGQILIGRFDLWNTGWFKVFIDRLPQRRAQLDDARSKFREIEAEFEDLGDPAVRKKILATLAEISPTMERIGADAHTESIAEAANFRADLREKQQLLSYLIYALISGGALVTLLIAYQNRYLTRAHKAATKSAKNFKFLARHDALTGLPNRTTFNIALQSAQTNDAARAGQIAVLAIDLDGFKSANDLLGHAAGDELLVAVGNRLKQLVDSAGIRNTVSRFGAEEFRILLHVSNELSEAKATADAVLSGLKQTFSIQGASIMIGATIGLAISSKDDEQKSDLLLDAVLALGDAKARGNGTVSVFNHTMREQYERRGHLEKELKNALARSEITPFYQPQIDLKTGRIMGVEALARWSHTDLGWVPPSEFIPIAEASSQIVELGRTILEAACQDTLGFPPEISLSVNLSVAQIMADDVVETVTKVLQRTGFPASRLTLEVTESFMITEAERTLEVLGQLKALGISIALDDFGTGYSALSYLRQFDWDELKIDRSFVANLGGDKRCFSIIGSIVHLAQELGMRVTAEGIETHEQSDLAFSAGCDVGQGYLYGRPMPISEMHVALLHNFYSKESTGINIEDNENKRKCISILN